MERLSALIEILLLPILLFIPTGIAGVSPILDVSNMSNVLCIEYDSLQKLIQIRCQSVHLTDIYSNVSDTSILSPEEGNKSINDNNPAKVWTLNAGIMVHKEGSLIIDSTDTSWLRITSTPTVQLKQKSVAVNEDADDTDEGSIIKGSSVTGNTQNMSNVSIIANGTAVVSKDNSDNPNGIHVFGSLKIDSVKITSWNPEKNDVIKFDFGKRAGKEDTKSEYDTAEPRAFIRVSKDATGTTNITNSEIAYLGYSCSKCSGLSYYGGTGSVIRDNDIHHLLKGFYSNKMGYMIIENNSFHDNYLYGIDPHTGTHDMIIRGNKVHHNNATAIVCSKDCYNILIEGNEVYDNLDGHRGIALSINSVHSVVQNNYVHDQDICVGLNRLSDYNKVYNNNLSNCNIGIDLTDTSNNVVYDNKISQAQFALAVQNVTNKIFNNKINNSTNGIVFSHVPINSDINSTNSSTYFLHQINTTNEVKGTENPVVIISNVVKNEGEMKQTSFKNETDLADDN